MLQTIRDNTQGVIAKIIIAVICIPFVLFGVETLLGSGGVNSVSVVNGEKITQQELNEEIYLQKRRLLSQMGDKVDPSQLEDDKLRQPALDSLVMRKVLLQQAVENDMSISDAAISQQIASNPDFQENGKFSKEKLEMLLAGAGLNTATYKRLLLRDLLLGQLADGVAYTGFITDQELAVNTRLSHQARDIRFIRLSLEKERAGVSVSPEEVRAYYDGHTEDFRSEELVTAEYIELKRSDFEEEVSEEQLKEAYDSEVEGFTPVDESEVAHILVEVDSDTSQEQATARLKEVQAKLAEGRDFSELAKEYSEDFGTREQGGMIGRINADVLPKSFVEAANALAKTGDLSGIVETDSGLHLIKMVSKKITVPPTLEDRRAALTAELRSSRAEPAFLAAVEELKDTAFNAADLSEPATANKLQIQEVSGISRKGGAGVFGNPAVYTKLFEDVMLKDRRNSDVIQLSQSQVVVVRVKEHSPSTVLPFEQAAEKVLAAALRDKAAQQMKAKSARMLEELKAGADVEATAVKNGVEWQLKLDARRTDAEVEPAILQAAFQLPRPGENTRAIDVIEAGNGDEILLVVDKVKDGRLESIAPAEASMIRTYMSQALGAREYKALESHIRASAEVE